MSLPNTTHHCKQQCMISATYSDSDVVMSDLLFSTLIISFIVSSHPNTSTSFHHPYIIIHFVNVSITCLLSFCNRNTSSNILCKHCTVLRSSVQQVYMHDQYNVRWQPVRFSTWQRFIRIFGGMQSHWNMHVILWLTAETINLGKRKRTPRLCQCSSHDLNSIIIMPSKGK